VARSTTSRTGWWKADLASKLWQDTARTSAITADGQTVKAMDDQQASNHFTEATNGPLWKSPSGLLLPALRFDGVNDQLLNNVAPSTFYSTTAKTILIAFRLLGDGTNIATIYENTMIVGDNMANDVFESNWFGLYVKTVAGAHTLFVYNWDGNEDTVSTTILKDTNYIIAVRHDGSNIYIGLNGGSETSAASGTTAGAGNCIRIAGNNRSTNQYLNCEIGELATYNAAITGAALSDTIQAMMDDWVTAPAGGILRQMMMRH